MPRAKMQFGADQREPGREACDALAGRERKSRLQCSFGGVEGAGRGLPMTHLAMPFTIAYPRATSALLGARTMDHLDDLLAGLEAARTDDILDRIDEIVPPGTDVGTLDQAYQPAALPDARLASPPPY
jgi:aryl-alcohol dehydrogenase-like predicted oxidoreductase